MAEPTEIDWALIKLGDGDSPEVFTIVCGIQDVTINQPVNTTDRSVRDCAAPGRVPTRKIRVNSRQMDVTGSGLSNAETIEDLNAALGKKRNYRIELYQDDETDTGLLLGTYAGEYVLTANNLTTTREGDSTAEITLASNGAWTYTPAP